MCESKDELNMLDPDSNEVFKRNNLDQTKYGPDSGISNAKYVNVGQVLY